MQTAGSTRLTVMHNICGSLQFPALLCLGHHGFTIHRHHHRIHLVVYHYGIHGGMDIQLAFNDGPVRQTHQDQVADRHGMGLPVEHVWLCSFTSSLYLSSHVTGLFQLKRITKQRYHGLDT